MFRIVRGDLKSDNLCQIETFLRADHGEIKVMNSKMKTGLLPLVVLITASGFCSIAQAQRVNHNVELRINDSQTMLDATTRGGCSNNNHPGCIEVSKGTQGRFNFSLVGNKSCDLASGATWVLGEVYLGGKGSTSKPNRWGGFQNDSDVKADFNLANEGTGQLVKESGSNQNSIVIFDDNSTENGYEIWYKVSAVCVDSDGNAQGTVEMDPRIKNGGME